MKSVQRFILPLTTFLLLSACESAVSAPDAVVPGTSGGESWVVSGGTAGLNMQSAWSRGTATFVGGATGVYRSDDAGATFRLSNTGNDAVGPTRGFADDATYLYSSASQGVFRSSDLGVTWTSKSTGITDLRTSGIVKAGTRLYVVGPSGVFRSDNQGDSWAAAGLVGVDVRSIAALGDVIVVGTNGAGIMKSVDFGATWVPSNTGLSGTTFRAVEVKGTTLFLGGANGSSVFRSTDGGNSWTQLAGGLPATSVRGFASNDQFIVAGTFGSGVFYSKNNGDTWAELNTGLSDKSIFDLVISNGFLIAATNTGGVFRIPVSSLK
ncbi:MAG: hypothetical protein RL625_110 [Gemmatimonadota bacterium]|jgi:hypothetical protein